MPLTSVPIGSLPYERFRPILHPDQYAELCEVVDRSGKVFGGRVVWNINSTARGGGVAEMLVSLLAYAHGAGVDARWEVIGGNPAFFALTKRIHNRLHSANGDGGTLGEEERDVYESTLRSDIEELAQRVDRRDIVIVHDPQPAGLIPALKRELHVPVIWRCHVGVDTPSPLAREAWDFLRPYIEPADAYVFSRESFVWEGLDAEKVRLIAPVIDAFSPKNQDLDERTVQSILNAAGLDGHGESRTPHFMRLDGSSGTVTHRAVVHEEQPLRPDDRIVVQVSRWDHLKDPAGVIRGFAEHVAPNTDAHLVYAGPNVDAVSDDPEGRAVLDEVRSLTEGLAADVRARIHLACLPMDDVDENGAIVNALQRRADVIVQKSLAEGFGLTVAEAMWKARPVVASRIGGIQDQIDDGVSGVLLDDPRDLTTFGREVAALLDDPERATKLGDQAQRQVRDHFLAVRSLMQYFDLMERLV